MSDYSERIDISTCCESSNTLRDIYAKESRVFRAIQMIVSTILKTMIVLSSPHTSVTFNTQISTQRVNVIRSCMNGLTFYLLQPQLQISFTDDLRRENASYICICFTYVAEFIFPSPCLASTCIILNNKFIRQIVMRMKNGPSKGRKSRTCSNIIYASLLIFARNIFFRSVEIFTHFFFQ